MNKKFLLFSVFVQVFISCANKPLQTPETFLVTSDISADTWDKGYGVANGRLGALEYGVFPNDTIVLNENSIFGKADIAFPPTVKDAIRKVRDLCNQGKYKEADDLFTSDILQHNDNYAHGGSYQQGGMLVVDFVDLPPQIGFLRTLDMLKGMAVKEVDFAEGKLTVQLIAVPQTECVAYRIKSTLPHGVTVNLELMHSAFPATIEDGKTFVLQGQGSNGGTRFENRLTVSSADGKIEVEGKKIRVRDSKEIIVLSTTHTDYNIDNPDSPLTYNLSEKNKQTLADAQKQTWNVMAATTEKYFSTYLNRCLIDIGATPESILAMHTPQRINRIKSGAEDDPDLIEKLFQFGRYCVVANSRPGGLPCGLQGIWNPYLSAPWRGCYFLNINCQMNYWLTESTNLSEFHEPFLHLVLGLQKGGEAFANALGYEGFCHGHNVDCWRKTYFRGDRTLWSASLLNGAWATAHLLEHYRFTNDKKFLKTCIPLLESNTRFLLQWFQPHPETGEYISGPSTSPENSFYINEKGKKVVCAVSNGNAHDLLLGRESLRNYIFACYELGLENELLQRAKQTLEKIPLPKIGADGRLMEWSEPFEECDKGHRHLSHCYGLFPGNEYDFLNTPQYVEAARKSIDFRIANGSGHTGWSESWIVNLYATLRDGEKVYTHINKMIARHINPNLFDMHPPFQIDGNFGIAQGVANCLLQSQIEYKGKRVILLAPALPKKWNAGNASGLCARGDITVNMQWDGEKISAQITADNDGEYTICCKGKMIDCKFSAGKMEKFEF